MKVNVCIVSLLLLLCVRSAFANDLISIQKNQIADGKMIVEGTIIDGQTYLQMGITVIKMASFTTDDVQATNENLECVEQVDITNNSFKFEYPIGTVEDGVYFQIKFSPLGSADVIKKYISVVTEQDKANAINQLKEATESQLDALFLQYSEYKPIFLINLDEFYKANKATIAKTFIAIRSEKSFVTKEDVEKAYAQANIIANANINQVTAEILTENDNILGITLSEDYAILKDSIVSLMNIIKGKRETKSFTTATDFANVYNESIAIAAINKAERSKMEETIIKYNNTLKLDLTGDYTKVDSIEVMKSLYSKNFEDITAIKSAFDSKIKALLLAISNGSGSKISGGSTGGSKNISISSSVVNNDVASDIVFDDIYSVPWAKEAIKNLYNKKIISGVENAKFAPNDNITREQFVKILVLSGGFAQTDAQLFFSDVAEAWYAPYIKTAVANELVTGMNKTTFGVGNFITRQDIATLIGRMIVKKGLILTSQQAPAFADFNEIADYAKDAVSQLAGAKIINGFEDNTFRPMQYTTRAEVAKLINAIYEMVVAQR